MDATKLLETQHREVEALFKKLLGEKDKRAKRGLFDEIAGKLVAHDAIEREIFYPACKRAMGMTDTLGEAYAEHGVVEFCLFEADQARNKTQFDFKVKALKDVVQHHVDEEEKELLPKALKALGKELNEKLGLKMEARFDTVVKLDYRAPLHDKLRQVLAGALITKPGAQSKTIEKTTRAKKTSPKSKTGKTTKSTRAAS